MNIEYCGIEHYLFQKGMPFVETGSQLDQLQTRCIFKDHDNGKELRRGHLYFNKNTTEYFCHHCGASGNIYTLAKHYGDRLVGDSLPKDLKSDDKKPKEKNKINPREVEKYHSQLTDEIRKYLKNERGLTDETITERKIGFGEFYGRFWIVIPIFDEKNECIGFKLRKTPCEGGNPKYIVYPKGNGGHVLYGFDLLKSKDIVMVCEGEFDQMLLVQKGIPAITCTGGVMTLQGNKFENEWSDLLDKPQKIYVCLDRDKAGEEGAEKIIASLAKKYPEKEIYKTTLPFQLKDDHGEDVTDYFVKHQGIAEDLMNKYSEFVAGRKPIDVSKFKEIDSEELSQTLGLTIKKDDENKQATFLCELSTYTEDSQFNISFNAPSSTGKSFIPTEIAKLFPKEDIVEIGYCSPTAFFHDVGKFNNERKGYEVDLSRKILIFLDQPHMQLLERLRPLLSHDKKEIHLKITDKSQKSGLRTKNVFIKGFPSVIFCSAGLRIDEQEGTRFILLSPEVNQEKLRQGIHEKIMRDSDADSYISQLENNPERILLKERIEAIKRENIRDVRISDPTIIEQIFLSRRLVLKPRHQRDIGRLISLIKAFALLNNWFRSRTGDVIVSSQRDVEEAVKIWDKISESQEYNLPPYLYDLYQDIILKAWDEKSVGLSGEKLGLTKQEIFKKHYKVYGRPITDWQLRKDIMPMLEAAGLVAQESDPNDKRKMLVYPTLAHTVYSDNEQSEETMINDAFQALDEVKQQEVLAGNEMDTNETPF